MAIEAEMMRLATQKKLSLGYYDDEMRLDARRISPPPKPRCHWSKRIKKENEEL